MQVNDAVLSKENIVTSLSHFLEQNIEDWCVKADINELCQFGHKQLLQMRVRCK